MKFYLLKESLEPKKSAMIYGFDPGYITSKVFQQGNLGYFEFPNEEVFFSGLHLKKGSVTVDFINTMGSYGGLGYLVSERAKLILEEFNLPTHKFYKIPILEFKGGLFQYYYIQILANKSDYSFLDFEKSTFFRTDFFKENRQLIKFHDEDEFKKAFESLDDLEEKIISNQIFLNRTFSESKIDMLRLKSLYSDFIINENIFVAFKENKITGIEMEEVSIIASSSKSE